MKPEDSRGGEKKTEPQHDERESRERTVAPPIEREHETQQGVFEEDEKRKHKGK
jgi:hypothetical protein